MILEDIKGIGKAKKELLNSLNIFTIDDLLFNKPRTYEDRKQFISLQKAVNRKDGKSSLVYAKIKKHTYLRGRNKKILKIIISDETLNAALICFNRTYMEKSYPVGEDIIVFGKFEFRFDEVQSTNFEIIKNADLNDSFEFGKIVPIYSLTEGLHQKFMRKITYYALSNLLKDKKEILPSGIINKRKLLKLNDALWKIHFFFFF